MGFTTLTSHLLLNLVSCCVNCNVEQAWLLMAYCGKSHIYIARNFKDDNLKRMPVACNAAVYNGAHIATVDAVLLVRKLLQQLLTLLLRKIMVVVMMKSESKDAACGGQLGEAVGLL